MAMLTYQEAATYLGIPRGTLYALVHDDQIPYLRFGPRLVRFDTDDLDRWRDARRKSPLSRVPDVTADAPASAMEAQPARPRTRRTAQESEHMTSTIEGGPEVGRASASATLQTQEPSSPSTSDADLSEGAGSSTVDANTPEPHPDPAPLGDGPGEQPAMDRAAIDPATPSEPSGGSRWDEPSTTSAESGANAPSILEKALHAVCFHVAGERPYVPIFLDQPDREALVMMYTKARAVTDGPAAAFALFLHWLFHFASLRQLSRFTRSVAFDMLVAIPPSAFEGAMTTVHVTELFEQSKARARADLERMGCPNDQARID